MGLALPTLPPRCLSGRMCDARGMRRLLMVPRRFQETISEGSGPGTQQGPGGWNCCEDGECGTVPEERILGPVTTPGPMLVAQQATMLLKPPLLSVRDAGLWLTAPSPKEEGSRGLEGFSSLRLQLTAPLLPPAAASLPGRHQTVDFLPHPPTAGDAATRKGTHLM